MIANLNMEYFSITNIVETLSDSTRTLTYLVNVHETLNGQNVQDSEIPCMTIWRKVGEHWMLISHVELSMPSVVI